MTDPSSTEASLRPSPREPGRAWRAAGAMGLFVGGWVWFWFQYGGTFLAGTSMYTESVMALFYRWGATGLAAAAGILAAVGSFVLRFLAINQRKRVVGQCTLRWGPWGIEERIDGVVWTAFPWDGVRATTMAQSRRIRDTQYNRQGKSRRGPARTVTTIRAIRFESPGGHAITVYPLDLIGGRLPGPNSPNSGGWFHRGLPCLPHTYLPKLMQQARAAGVKVTSGRVEGSELAAGRVLIPFVPEQWTLGAAGAALMASAYVGGMFGLFGWPGYLLAGIGVLLLCLPVRGLFRQLRALSSRPGSGERVTLVSGTEERITVRSDGKTRVVDLTGVVCSDAFIHKRTDVDLWLTVAAGEANPYRGGIERATRIEVCARSEVRNAYAYAAGLELIGASALVVFALLLSFPNLL